VGGRQCCEGHTGIPRPPSMIDWSPGWQRVASVGSIPRLPLGGGGQQAASCVARPYIWTVLRVAWRPDDAARHEPGGIVSIRLGTQPQGPCPDPEGDLDHPDTQFLGCLEYRRQVLAAGQHALEGCECGM